MTPTDVYVLILSPIFAVALIGAPLVLALRDVGRSLKGRKPSGTRVMRPIAHRLPRPVRSRRQA